VVEIDRRERVVMLRGDNKRGRDRGGKKIAGWHDRLKRTACDPESKGGICEIRKTGRKNCSPMAGDGISNARPGAAAGRCRHRNGHRHSVARKRRQSLSSKGSGRHFCARRNSAAPPSAKSNKIYSSLFSQSTRHPIAAGILYPSRLADQSHDRQAAMRFSSVSVIANALRLPLTKTRSLVSSCSRAFALLASGLNRDPRLFPSPRPPLAPSSRLCVTFSSRLFSLLPALQKKVPLVKITKACCTAPAYS